MEHLHWAQRRYKELLLGRDTFEIVSEPVEVRSEHETTFWDNEARPPRIAAEELLRHDQLNRLTCPFIYVVLLAGVQREPGYGEGAAFNGCVNKGGGIVVLPAPSLVDRANIQSDLRHELGHTFGLVHVDQYRKNLYKNPSIMSYDPSHHTTGFSESPIPAELIPEDFRVLAQAERIFPSFFQAEYPIPTGYQMWMEVCSSPLPIPGQEAFLAQLA